jgi:medium-chain acyl-[acyl-carrier-protein] hydrolase
MPIRHEHPRLVRFHDCGQDHRLTVPSALRWFEEIAENFGVRRGDLDYNGHVNNIRYVEWALETLPPEFSNGRRLTRLLARYRGETKYGAEVRATADVDGDLAHHLVTEGDREACRLETTWA